MALLWQNTAEGGTLGVAVTGANSGGASGNAFSVPGNTGTVTYDNAYVLDGAKAVKCVGSSTQFAYVGTGQFFNTRTLASRCGIALDVAVTAAQDLHQIRNATTAAFKWQLSSGNKIWAINAAGGLIGTGHPTMTPRTMYRLEEVLLPGTATAAPFDGQVDLAIYEGNATTPIWSYTAQNVNLGTTPLLEARWGKITGSGSAMTVWLDSPGIAEQTGPLGPWAAANIIPTVSAGSSVSGTAEPFDEVTITAVASDPDGSITGLTVTQTAGPAVTLVGSGNSRKFIAPPTFDGTTVSFTWAATDNSGDTGTGSVSIPVFPHNEWAWDDTGALSRPLHMFS